MSTPFSLAGLILFVGVVPALARIGRPTPWNRCRTFPGANWSKSIAKPIPAAGRKDSIAGTSSFSPCIFLAGPREGVANFVWQGKHFCDATLINQWRGVRMIKAEVGPGDSWLDGRPAHILDYRHTSLLWSDVRDETREVSPGVYVGAMYQRRCPEPRLKLLFILEKAGPPCP